MQTEPVQITRRRDGKSAFPASPVGFDERLKSSGVSLVSARIDTLQVNVGKLCNQACKHCHVDASPTRTEIMSRATVEACLNAVRDFKIPTLDVTGGAPELVPDFRYLVVEARKIGAKIIVRHNLTVMFEPNQTDLPEFFAANRVEVVSSLPYFLAQQTDAQRGAGVFDKSVEAMKRLNAVGYGVEGANLTLNLVYNPTGAFLPPAQSQIETDFRRELRDRHNLFFNNLFTITNVPVARYLDYLRRSGNEEKYMRKLIGAFNAATLQNLMCRNLVSVDWTGKLYDCDFNQMLKLNLSSGLPQTIFDFDAEKLANRSITTANHCFGCTAGSGSSCGGAVVVP